MPSSDAGRHFGLISKEAQRIFSERLINSPGFLPDPGAYGGAIKALNHIYPPTAIEMLEHELRPWLDSALPATGYEAVIRWEPGRIVWPGPRRHSEFIVYDDPKPEPSFFGKLFSWL